MAADPRSSSARTIVAGIGALVAILASLVGLPLLLLKFGGNPLPASIPAPAEVLAALTRPDDGSLFLGGLRILGWLAWAGWTLSLLSCIRAQLAGRRPPRLPGWLSWQQARASALTGAVSAMIALIVTSTTAPAATAAAAPAQGSAAGGSGGPTVATAPAHPASATTPVVAPTEATRQVQVVKGDTLWGIAERHLGEGARYPEVYAASRGTVQPDGRRLRDPDKIRPGWTITVPTTGSPQAPTAHPDAVTDPSAAAPGGGSAAGVSGEATAGVPAAGGASARPGASAEPGAGTQNRVDQEPPSAAAAPSPPSSGASPAEASPSPADTADAADDGEDSRRSIGVGALAAAGLLGLLALARARQSRRRAPGRRIAMPTGRPAAAEAELRAGADPLAVSDLNRALRTLAGRAHTLGTPMPGLRAARITADALEFYLVDADDQLPAPFTCLDEGAWTLHRPDLTALLTDDEAGDIPAPYPTLVTIGHDEQNALLLLNLEELGALGLTGDPRLCREVLTAITVELIASTWADDTRITLVRLMPELVDALGSDRASYTDSLDSALAGLVYTAGVHRQALQAADQPGATQARVAHVVDESWTPHLLVIAGGVTAAQRELLAELVATHPRVAIAAVTADTDPVGEWSLHVTGDGDAGRAVATLAPVPLVLTPQRLVDERYLDLVRLYQTTEDPDVDGPEWASELDPQAIDLTTLTPAHPPLDETSAVEDDTTPTGADLGENDGDTAPDAATISPTAGHGQQPGAHSPDDPPTDRLDEPAAQDPGEDAADEQSSPGTTAQAAGHPPADEAGEALILAHPATQPQLRLLGAAPALTGARGKRPGSPKRSLEILTYLALHPGQPYHRFDEAIFPGERVTAGKRNQYVSNTRNWVGFADDGHPYVALVEDSGYRLADDFVVDWQLFQHWITPSVTAAATDRLRAALALVDGQPLSGVDADRYQFAMSDQAEILASVADVAHELARRSIGSGDSRTATWAAAKGLQAEPVSEALWRDAITAAYLSGDRDRVRDVIARCRAVLEPLGADLDDETQDLINQSLRMPAHA